MNSATSCQNDFTFGPAVIGCRGNFDFTLLFEQIVFSIVPAGLFILLSIWRLTVITSSPTLIGGPQFRAAKLVRHVATSNGV